MTNVAKTYETDRAVLVSQYATPFAVLMVLMALGFSQPQGITRTVTWIVLIASVLLNGFGIFYFKRYPAASWMIRVRMLLNLAFNTVLVYYLESYWAPIWLLLALTPIATAIYGTRAQTAVSAFGVALLLLTIYAHDLHSPLELSEAVANASFIVVVSFLINHLLTPRL